jgi:hypothetical protein
MPVNTSSYSEVVSTLPTERALPPLLNRHLAEVAVDTQPHRPHRTSSSRLTQRWETRRTNETYGCGLELPRLVAGAAGYTTALTPKRPPASLACVLTEPLT